MRSLAEQDMTASTLAHADDIASVLEKAAELLETRGWGQTVYEDGDGRLCALGAIRTAIAGSNREFANLAHASATHTNVLRRAWRTTEPLTRQVGDIPTWNDVEGREAHEVIDLMKHTAKDLRNRASMA